MVDLRPLKCAYHNYRDATKKKMLAFIIDLLEFGVRGALMKFLTYSAVKDHLTLNSVIALVTVLNSEVGDVTLEVDLEGDGDGDAIEERKEGKGEVVCALHAVRSKDLVRVKASIEKERRLAMKKGKRMVEEMQKGNKKLVVVVLD